MTIENVKSKPSFTINNYCCYFQKTFYTKTFPSWKFVVWKLENLILSHLFFQFLIPRWRLLPHKVAAVKNFFFNVYVIDTTCFNECFFILYDNYETFLFKMACRYFEIVLTAQSVHWGINTPLPPVFLAKSPLNQQTFKALFLGNPSLYIGFHEPSRLKLRFFSKSHKY